MGFEWAFSAMGEDRRCSIEPTPPCGMVMWGYPFNQPLFLGKLFVICSENWSGTLNRELEVLFL